MASTRSPDRSFFVPQAQAGTATSLSLNIAIRTTGDPRTVAVGVEEAVRELDSNVPISNLRTMEDLLATSLARRRFTLELMGMFALVALLMTVTGVYGVVAYSVSQRVPEIGIRMALGARPAQIVQLMISRGIGLTLAGAAVGLALALALARLLTGMLFAVHASDPLVYGTSALVLIVSAIAASYLPARRAGRIDPLAALRQE